MGWRFRKSIRLVPGVRLNVGKKGVSVSAGARGFKTTVGTSGRTTTVGMPGTGLSHTSRKGRSRKEAPQVAALASIHTVSEPMQRSPRRRWLGWAIVLFIALCLFVRYSG